MSKYPNTVSGGLDERRGKFALAEGLATDIPRTKSGPTADGDTAVRDQLVEARQALIDAGAEPRSVRSLDDYRRTALWVSRELAQNFAWASGRSWSSHVEAYKAGLTYDEYVALDDDEAKVDAIREANGKPTTHAGTIKDGTVEAIKSDPEVAKAIAKDEDAIKTLAEDPQVGAALRKAMRGEPKQKTHDDGDDGDDKQDNVTSVGLKLSKAVYEVEEVLEWLNDHDDLMVKVSMVTHNDRAQRLLDVASSMLAMAADIPDDISDLAHEDAA